MAEFNRDYWRRDRVAAALGVSTAKLKRMVASGVGPMPLKMGPTKQARCFWESADVLRYVADPVAYRNQSAADASASADAPPD